MREGIRLMLSRRVGTLLAATALGVLGSAGVASAATFTVNDTTDAPLATSTSTACSSTHGGTCTLRAAVQAADNTGGANTIVVPAGTYTYTIPPASSTDVNDPATGDLDVLNTNGSTGGVQLTVTGAGSGSTIIDPNHLDRAFSVDQTTSSLSISGVTIENGTAVTREGSSAYPYSTCDYSYYSYTCGGAIYSVGPLTLSSDVTLSGNHADYGGAVTNDYAGTGANSLRVADATFTGNTATYEGGGLYQDSGSSVNLVSSTFKGNSSDSGGAISDEYSSSFSSSQNLFTGNTATTSGNTGAANGYGGAMYLDSCGNTYVVNHSEFDTNTAGYGGAVEWYCGNLSSDGSSMISNTATTDGGAVYADSGGFLALTNATIDKNTAAYGGGFYVTYSMPSDMINDTLYQNGAAAAGQGGGMYGTHYISAYTVGVENTVVAGSTGGDCGDSGSSSQVPASADAGYNMDSDGSCFNGSTDKKATPLLGASASNGGPVAGSSGNTEQIQTNAELAGSPTIDAGTDSNCPATDARGVARPQGASCDIGAFETYLGAGQLSLAKTAPTSAPAGSVFDYTISVGDRGPGQSTTTTVTDQLPAGTTLYAAGSSAGGCTTSGSPAKVTCDLGTLQSGSGATVTIAVSNSQQGSVTNTASVSNDQGASATGSATTQIGPPTTGTAPTASTGGATKVTSSSARLGGSVGNGGQRTGYFFEVGTTSRYGTITRVTYTTTPENVSVLVRGLESGRKYHYRLVAVNDTGVAYGRDRTFKTKGSYLGALLLDGRKLIVKGDKLYAKFTCKSAKACVFRFSIGVHAQVKKTKKTATVLFLKAKTTLKRIGAHKTVTVTASVTNAGLALLKKTSSHSLAGKLSTRPRTSQKGIIDLIRVVLK